MKLRKQNTIVRLDANTFECKDLDVEEAYPSSPKLVDSDQEGDSEIEVEWRHHWSGARKSAGRDEWWQQSKDASVSCYCKIFVQIENIPLN